MKPPIDMKPLLDDPTDNKQWLDAQIDRLLAFELLNRTLHARYQPLQATLLADKTGLNRSAANKIINLLRTTIHDY